MRSQEPTQEPKSSSQDADTMCCHLGPRGAFEECQSLKTSCVTILVGTSLPLSLRMRRAQAFGVRNPGLLTARHSGRATEARWDWRAGLSPSSNSSPDLSEHIFICKMRADGSLPWVGALGSEGFPEILLRNGLCGL